MKMPVIICVDDEQLIVDSLKEQLKIILPNYMIMTETNSKDAMDLFNELMEEGIEVPLVISDYLMPHIKGDELLTRIHKTFPNTVKVMLTGHASLEGVVNAINNANLYRYVSKPWEKEDLQLTVKQALESFYKDRQLEEKNKTLRELNDSLEIKVEKRTEELTESLSCLKEREGQLYTLLDNSGQGFLCFRNDFIIESEYSAECREIFGCDIAGINISSLLFNNDKGESNNFARTINMILETVDDFKQGVLISLLPAVITIKLKTVNIKYRLVQDSKVMLVLTDITREKELESQIIEEQERMKFIVSSFAYKDDFYEVIVSYKFFKAEGLSSILQSNMNFHEKYNEIYRNIHTFKGLFSQFHFINMSRCLNTLESEISEVGKVDADEKYILKLIDECKCTEALDKDMKIIHDLFDDDMGNQKNRIYVEEEQVLELEKNLKDMLHSYPKYTYELSERLGKNIERFIIQGSNVKVDPAKYSRFTKSLVHIFRNSVDHGIETSDERIEAGKSDLGKITCSVEKTDTSISIVIEDDGRGINIQKIKDKAIEKGIKFNDRSTCFTDVQLIDLIFSDSFSTKDSSNEISGRGYGLSAVIGEMEKINGTIQVCTSLGGGTKFVFTFLDKEESC